MEVDGLDLGRPRAGQGPQGVPGQVLGAERADQGRQEGGQVRGQDDPPGHAAGAVAYRPGDGTGRLLVGPVLQETGEEQVAGLQVLHVRLLLTRLLGQEAVGLERHEGSGHHQELAGLPQVG